MTMSQLWPPVSPRTLERQVWNTTTAQGVPGLARALQVYGGLIGSCMLQLAKGRTVAPVAPRLLQQPDPDLAFSTFVRVHVEDWWLHGNAVHLVTSRKASGQVASVRWFPAHRWGITEDRATAQPVYHLDGHRVDRDDVVHVQRGADPSFPYRGLGVVEQHLRTLNRAGLEEAAESAALRERNMPNVTITMPEKTEADEDEMDAAATKWAEKFRGPEPKPAVLPYGTVVTPLSWNPSEGQMVEARKMTLVDVANIMNLDGYWIGAEGSSHNYKSPGLMFLALMKMSLGPVMDPFEQVWSRAWLPPAGQRVQFDRVTLLRDDLGTMMQAFEKGSRFFPDPNEPREYMGFPPLPEEAFAAAAPPAAPEPTAPEPDETDDADTEEEA